MKLRNPAVGFGVPNSEGFQAYFLTESNQLDRNNNGNPPTDNSVYNSSHDLSNGVVSLITIIFFVVGGIFGAGVVNFYNP